MTTKSLYWKHVRPTDKVIKKRLAWVVVRDGDRHIVDCCDHEADRAEGFMMDLLSKQEETR